jgi:hypothetical protein
MKEILETLSAAQGWVFDYGRPDFHNLIDESKKDELNADRIFLLLDPVKIKKNMNDSGVVESITYSGSLMLLLSSDIDEVDYDFRYENYIKPLRANQLETIINELTCEQEATVQDWNETEVINVLDNNLDGIIVSYVVKIDL